jgi:serine protease AprX
MVAAIFATALSAASFFALQTATDRSVAGSGAPAASPADSTSPLAALAASHPGKRVEVIVQLRPGVDLAEGAALVRGAGGVVEHPLPLINGFGTTLTADEAQRLSWKGGVHAVSLNAAVETDAVDPSRLATAYIQSVRANKVWNGTGQLDGTTATGKGVGVAVLDTGINGSLPDFRVSRADGSSRVVASAIVNPAATRPGDSFGHGTHIAGLIAGNGLNRPAADPLNGKYIGVAPDANLIDVKIADEQGNASVMDVIDGLQFAVDYKADYNIRIANLSLRSTVAESYRTDPLDAAVEAAWNSGLVVIVAAGNEGTADDAVDYAPANDPYVITVGATDDAGTKAIDDDALESWSSRGTTQDGFEKPDVLAPGSHMVSTMSPGAEYTRLCPTCVTDGSYFRVGGTSMAAGVASGEAALLLEVDPTLTPNEVKAQLVRRTRAVESAKPTDQVLVDASGAPVAVDQDQFYPIEGAELAADKAVVRDVRRQWNTGLTMNTLLDPATGQIDYTRASWSRASWSNAAEGLRASWSRASWSRASWSRASWSATPESCADLERASWSRASWSRASWSRASWSRASWSADGMSAPDLSAADISQIDAEIAAAQAECSSLLAQIDPARASWSRASWSRASWSSSFTK